MNEGNYEESRMFMDSRVMGSKHTAGNSCSSSTTRSEEEDDDIIGGVLKFKFKFKTYPNVSRF